MNKKIIILNGSPRTNGNTAALIDAFIAGAESSGNTVTRFDLKDMNIHGCLGCCKGGKNAESPCVQRDDMNKIYPHYKEADVIVLASPMYYWSITGQLKCAFDRLFAVAECNANFANPTKTVHFSWRQRVNPRVILNRFAIFTLPLPRIWGGRMWESSMQAAILT